MCREIMVQLPNLPEPDTSPFDDRGHHIACAGPLFHGPGPSPTHLGGTPIPPPRWPWTRGLADGEAPGGFAARDKPTTHFCKPGRVLSSWRWPWAALPRGETQGPGTLLWTPPALNLYTSTDGERPGEAP